jgi:large subunit ribosomal protein L24
MKLKKGDNIIVVAGKDKGKKGVISRVLVAENRVVVDGVNVVKKQRRARRSTEKGSVIDVAMPIHASNVMFLDPKKGVGTRLGKKKVGETFVRIAKKSEQEI